MSFMHEWARLGVIALLVPQGSACMNTPVLDGARVVAPGAWRADVQGSLPISQDVLPNEPAGDDETQTDQQRWKRLAFYPAFALVGHNGMRNFNAQADFSIASNGMVGVGAKAPFLEHDALTLSTGLQFHWMIFGALSEDLPGIMKITLPLWVGLAPAPWCDLYFAERVQLWWFEPMGVTAVTTHTAGFRLGGRVGVLAEVTYLWDPFQSIDGVQAGLAFYLEVPTASQTTAIERTGM